jgi:dihydropyrimidinase
MRFPAVYYFGVGGGHLTLNQWVAVCCANPARLFGLRHKGEIAPGYDADLVIFDPNQEVTLSPETLHETAGWTLYEGLTLRGWPQTTLIRGQFVVRDGGVCGRGGNGRFVKRSYFE